MTPIRCHYNLKLYCWKYFFSSLYHKCLQLWPYWPTWCSQRTLSEEWVLYNRFCFTDWITVKTIACRDGLQLKNSKPWWEPDVLHIPLKSEVFIWTQTGLYLDVTAMKPRSLKWQDTIFSKIIKSLWWITNLLCWCVCFSRTLKSSGPQRGKIITYLLHTLLTN